MAAMVINNNARRIMTLSRSLPGSIAPCALRCYRFGGASFLGQRLRDLTTTALSQYRSLSLVGASGLTAAVEPLIVVPLLEKGPDLLTKS